MHFPASAFGGTALGSAPGISRRRMTRSPGPPGSKPLFKALSKRVAERLRRSHGNAVALHQLAVALSLSVLQDALLQVFMDFA